MLVIEIVILWKFDILLNNLISYINIVYIHNKFATKHAFSINISYN